MTTATRVKITVAAGLVLGLETWILERSAWPTAGLHDVLAPPLGILALAALFVVPLVVGRLWVVGALLGPLLALAVMQVAGLTVRLDDGTGPAFNYRTTFQLCAVGFILLFLAGLQTVFRPRDRDGASPRDERDGLAPPGRGL